MTDPRYSIITVTKNNISGLRRTEASVRAQTCTDYEWLVIDGASNDGTLHHYKPVLSAPDKGLYDAMNKGIGMARGHYLLFLNAGDCLASPDVLGALCSFTSDFIYGDALEDGHLKPARHDMTRGMITHHQAMLYRREAIGGLRYNLCYPLAADYDFTWRFIRQSAGKAYIPIAICDYESGGLSQTKAASGRRQQFFIRREMGVPFYKGAAIYCQQSCVWAIRRLAPKLFWRVRSRHSNAPWQGHTQTPPCHQENRAARHSHT